MCVVVFLSIKSKVYFMFHALIDLFFGSSVRGHSTSYMWIFIEEFWRIAWENSFCLSILYNIYYYILGNKDYVSNVEVLIGSLAKYIIQMNAEWEKAVTDMHKRVIFNCCNCEAVSDAKANKCLQTISNVIIYFHMMAVHICLQTVS